MSYYSKDEVAVRGIIASIQSTSNPRAWVWEGYRPNSSQPMLGGPFQQASFSPSDDVLIRALPLLEMIKSFAGGHVT